jgi:hypothetical protein
MHDDTIEPFWFPAVGRKKLTAGFDGGRLTLDGGVMLLAAAGRRIGIAQRLASLITGGLRLPMVSCRPAAEPPPAARWQSHKHGSAESIVHPPGQARGQAPWALNNASC